MMSGWAQHLEPGVDRRALLLKLSFALTLAASSSVEASTPPAEALPAGHMPDLRGIWRSEYTYMSSGREEEFRDVHFVVVDQKGRNLNVTSLPHSTGSNVRIALTLDGLAATGTWEERTSPTGYYKGTIYRGAIQLLLTPSMTHMTGKWLGFGKEFSIDTGAWDLTLEDRSMSARTRAGYDLRV
ncbi:hypothetical protein SAMN05444365_101657 [Micromonospora pattaloongensis]|uniref:Uncharacterized protein n=1 Tax=Micromonospora pattaloongensis TaxID=405436 RepID=A0A1H3H2N4_9ACTN|nr:hypothetical protein [Micromonospora pattaloongensis]SDY09772.1 hypothetical protein SAMN05444365_101657 [Micromonospora pattaloongensis]